MKSENNSKILQVSTYGSNIENLAVLESMVWEEIKNQCANIDRSIFRFRFLFQLSQTIVALFLLLLSLVVVLPPAAAEVARLVSEQLPSEIPGLVYWFLSLFVWVGSGLVFLLPITSLAGKIPRGWMLAIYLYIWQPLGIAIVWTITSINEFSIEKVIGVFIGSIILIVLGIVVVIALLFLLRSTVVQNLSFLLTLISLKEPMPIHSSQEQIFPNKTRFTHSIVSALRPKLNGWDRTTWQNISLLVEHKSTEGGLQTQYASFILAALALLGLLPIIVSNGFEVISIKTADFLDIFSSQSGISVKTESIQWWLMSRFC